MPGSDTPSSQISRPEPDRGAISFAEKVLTVLAEGSFVATYKYAVLLGLMDLCLEGSVQSGAAPGSVTTTQLAEKIVELYWPHTAAYGDTNAAVLKQNSGGQAEILSYILRFRERHAPDPSATLPRARAHAATAFETLVGKVEWKLVEMPLPRLQIVGEQLDPFLYEINWDRAVRASEFRDRPNFDNVIRFVGQGGDHLVRVSGLLRPLIQREWSAMVARFNSDRVPEAGLEDFLFGGNRISMEPVRNALLELDHSQCFYCGRGVRTNFAIDHFVPWARYPNNGLENLVVADPQCNGAKSDHLAAAEHVKKWTARAAARARELDEIAQHARWDRHAERSIGVARSIYLRMPEDGLLWRMGRNFVHVDRALLEQVLGGR